ncbi:MAG TPA: DUF3822 family protein [Bacteroidales bacterium]|nr:DUF3822 family protein [Bacteroidales bacterium]
MNHVNIEEPGILKINSKEIEMSMQISLHGLSFCLLHLPEKKIVALNHLPNNTGKAIEDFFVEQWNSNRLINKDYASFKFIYPYKRLTLVPEALFNENDAELVFNYNFSKLDSEILKSVKMSKSESFAVFAIPINIYNIVNSQIDGKWMPHIMPFAEANIKNFRLDEDIKASKMYINYNDEFIDILLVDETGIKMYNNFIVKSANDIVYFILNIFDKLKLNPEKVNIEISGNINPDNYGIVTLQKFIRNVYFVARRQDLKYTYLMQDIQPHVFSNLINLAACEL